jgi:Mg2+ and Co2+ transporter CorA
MIRVLLLEAFHCHPLAIDDAHRERHPPKIEEFEHHTLIIYRGISSFDRELNYTPQQMAFFLSDDYLISLHPSGADSIDHLYHHEGATLHAINDVFERFERLHSLTQMYYDICGDLVDGYISISSHQLNITMRVLTVITAIFVPLTFLAGIYGMNFAHMPELPYRYGYPVLLLMMLAIGAGLLWVFWRKKWL